MNPTISAWLYAFRLRTLPLAFSSIIAGNGVAYSLKPERFSWAIFGLTLLTTLLLQILSNLANDYGDSEKGTDNENRIGPKRAVQAGMLSVNAIKSGIVVAGLLSFFSGCFLLYVSFGKESVLLTVLFLLLGLSAIAAAIKYTVGKNAYGYNALGDVFVLLFFGIVGVAGSYFLQAQQMEWKVLLPGFGIGAFATGVLNLNNMRDRISDQQSGKITVAVKLGAEQAVNYHTLLITAGWISCILYVLLSFTSTMQFLFVLSFPLFRKHIALVKRVEHPAGYDPFLKQLAISTFLFALLFAAGLVIGAEG